MSRVLLVEDDMALLEAMKELLEYEGFDVTLASNGLEALEVLRDGDLPCVILLDLMMPVMSGWEFRAEQRRDPKLAGIPTVVVSAYHPDPSAPDLEVAGYLRKPVQPRELIALLREQCG